LPQSSCITVAFCLQNAFWLFGFLLWRLSIPTAATVTHSHLCAPLQTFPTIPGALYNLIFALTLNPEGDSPSRTLVVSVANLTGPASRFFTLSFDAERSIRNMMYSVQTLTFRAVDYETTLMFAENDLEPTAYGVVIDYVAVTYNGSGE
jgi:hypothetical protein